MWRVELYHPIAVHFPIGLLGLGTLLRLLVALRSQPQEAQSWGGFLHAVAQLLTIIGGIAAWGAYVTGTWAEAEVNSVLCDPTITHLHGAYACYTTLLFSTIACWDIGLWVIRQSRLAHSRVAAWWSTRVVRGIVYLVATAGLALLVYTGHLGASLTYQQGAAVYQPSPTCTEFADPTRPGP